MEGQQTKPGQSASLPLHLPCAGEGGGIMKKFWAGLALALVATVILQSRKRAGGELRRREGSGGKKQPPQSRGDASPQPEPSRRAATASVGATTAEARTVESDRPAPPLRAPKSEEEMLNSATRQQLLSVYGIGPVLADRIIQNRPYAVAHDVVRQGIIPESTFAQLRKQLLEQAGVWDSLAH